MMTFEQYRRLPQGLQAGHLWKDGVYLELVREQEDLNVELYALYQFYVEIFFDRESGDPLILRPFSDPALLEAYLDKIPISGAFALH